MVVDETSDLPSMNQAGSLNESFADIIASLVDDDDWQLGEDRTGGFGALRNMADPANGLCGPFGLETPCNAPDRMSAYDYANAAAGGTHKNANINNKAYYLMAAGGVFNGRTVQPMGRGRMGALAYQVLTTLPKTTNFWHARDAAVAAAQAFVFHGLYGYDAATVCSVREAYRAVELGIGDADCDGVEDTFEDDDGDGILSDGDESWTIGDNPCMLGNTIHCDDNCPSVANPTQSDYDLDGVADACDVDDDNDGWPDAIDQCPGIAGSTGDEDDDGIPDCLDGDDDNDGIVDQLDNCKGDANPDQFDGNDDGFGDACDPDVDGDGFYAGDDNCTFVANPNQADGDGDGIGNACDACPNAADNTGAYTPGMPELGIDPAPLQPDSDGDGIPNACDPRGFGNLGLVERGRPVSLINALRPDGRERRLDIIASGNARGLVRMPSTVCGTRAADVLASNQRVEVELTSLPRSVDAWIEDDAGLIEARFRTDRRGGSRRGLRFRPRCDERYELVLRPETIDGRSRAFTATARTVVPRGTNPWASGLFGDRTPLPTRR